MQIICFEESIFILLSNCSSGRTHEKTAVLLDSVQMRGEGEGPAQIFRQLFIGAFLVNIGSLLPPKCQ